MYLEGDDHASHMRYSINFTTKLFKHKIAQFFFPACSSGLSVPRRRAPPGEGKKLIKSFAALILERNGSEEEEFRANFSYRASLFHEMRFPSNFCSSSYYFRWTFFYILTFSLQKIYYVELNVPARLITVQPFRNGDKNKLLNFASGNKALGYGRNKHPERNSPALSMVAQSGARRARINRLDGGSRGRSATARQAGRLSR